MPALKLQLISGNTWTYVDPSQITTRFSVKSALAQKSVDGVKLSNATALMVYNKINEVVQGDNVARDPISVRISTSGATASKDAIKTALKEAYTLAMTAVEAGSHAGLTPGFDTAFIASETE